MINTAILVEPELYTEADLECLSQEGYHFELIEGELKLMAPTGGGHGLTTIDLSTFVNHFVLMNDLGRCFGAETGFRISEEPRTILAPDFAFIAKARVPNPIPDGFVPVVPDLVLETRSPGDTAREVAEKVARWLDAGAQIVWEMNPRRKVLTVYSASTALLTLGETDVLDGGELLPGFTLNLSRIFG